jgi:hypothetical protein
MITLFVVLADSLNVYKFGLMLCWLAESILGLLKSLKIPSLSSKLHELRKGGRRSLCEKERGGAGVRRRG